MKLLRFFERIVRIWIGNFYVENESDMISSRCKSIREFIINIIESFHMQINIIRNQYAFLLQLISMNFIAKIEKQNPQKRITQIQFVSDLM